MSRPARPYYRRRNPVEARIDAAARAWPLPAMQRALAKLGLRYNVLRARL